MIGSLKSNIEYKRDVNYLLERSLVIGISCISRLMHNHSPNNAINARPVPVTTHHVIEDGHPPYTIQIKRWTIYSVAAKSKHLLALLMIRRRKPALLDKEIQSTGYT